MYETVNYIFLALLGLGLVISSSIAAIIISLLVMQCKKAKNTIY